MRAAACFAPRAIFCTPMSRGWCPSRGCAGSDRLDNTPTTSLTTFPRRRPAQTPTFTPPKLSVLIDDAHFLPRIAVAVSRPSSTTHILLPGSSHDLSLPPPYTTEFTRFFYRLQTSYYGSIRGSNGNVSIMAAAEWSNQQRSH